jgi:hypothetical protein
MEFPSDWAVFNADEFGTAAPRSHGEAVMELMIQARPNGRLPRGHRRQRDPRGRVQLGGHHLKP